MFLIIMLVALSHVLIVDSAPALTLPIGTLQGLETEATYECLGIKYANIDRRWSPAVDLYNKSFEQTIYHATQFGPC